MADTNQLETIDDLYRALQRLKRPWVGNDQARWYVIPKGTRDWYGPFEAVEVAYQIYVGETSLDDSVVNSQTWNEYLVSKHSFLAAWSTANAEKEKRLLKGLLKSYDRLSTRRGKSRQRRTRSAFRPRLTPEQRKAYRLLDLAPNASTVESKKRHRELALRHHPDRGGSLERMKEINWAYAVVQETSLH